MLCRDPRSILSVFVGPFSFSKILVFNQLLGANFVRDSQVTLRKAAINDRPEDVANSWTYPSLRSLRRPRQQRCWLWMIPNLRRVYAHCRHGIPFGQTLRQSLRTRLYILVIHRGKNVVPVDDEAAWR